MWMHSLIQHLVRANLFSISSSIIAASEEE